jgi:hypothetical protein
MTLKDGRLRITRASLGTYCQARNRANSATSANFHADVLRGGQFNLLDERRIVVIRARAVDALGDRPFLQKVIRRWLEQFNAGLASQPRFEVLLGKKHWHPIVHLADKGIRFGDDHGA